MVTCQDQALLCRLCGLALKLQTCGTCGFCTAGGAGCPQRVVPLKSHTGFANDWQTDRPSVRELRVQSHAQRVQRAERVWCAKRPWSTMPSIFNFSNPLKLISAICWNCFSRWGVLYACPLDISSAGSQAGQQILKANTTGKNSDVSVKINF